MTSTFEKLVVYVSLVCGTLFALLTNGGTSFFSSDELLRGVVFLAMTVLTLVGWVGPFIKRWRAAGLSAGRLLAAMFVLLSALNFVRENFISSLPKIWP